MDVAILTMDDNNSSSSPSNNKSTSGNQNNNRDSPINDANDIMRMLTDSQLFNSFNDNETKSNFERLFGSAEDSNMNQMAAAAAAAAVFGLDTNAMSFGGDMSTSPFAAASTLRNSTKTLKCPKCNWHYKYQETLEIHMKEKHSDTDVKCIYCADNRQHPKLARGETYSCGYKPYRCDLCRYSTTTKGNLSIHMQSDKHLHAVQELPNSIANFACGPVSRSSPIEDVDASFVCLICGIFATESLREMIEHVEKDRSRPTHGDVSVANGTFRCHLCPYNTTLKANFQLHTRTDKHLQKVSTANHLREGSRPHTAIYRLATTKTCVQVLCRQCHEVISSVEALREHYHQRRVGQQIWRCKICRQEFDTQSAASGHMTCHEPSTWPNDKIDFKMMDDALYACAGCNFNTKDAHELEEHTKTHDDDGSSTANSSEETARRSSSNKTCPLCMESTADLEKHLIADHRIAETAIDKLLLVDSSKETNSSSIDTEYAYRCSKCSMAFRSESKLSAHCIEHVFSTQHKCPTCQQAFGDNDALTTHIISEHGGCIEPNQQQTSSPNHCDVCSESFVNRDAFVAHLNTAKHLQMAKKHLETSAIDLNSQQIAFEHDDSKVFRCNVCKVHYAQSVSLEIHLRSVAHQNRMARLPELTASGEVDAEKLLVEQPGSTSGTIRQFIEQTAKQMSMSDVMSLLMRGGADESKEELNGIQVLTQIKVYGEEKITNHVDGLDKKIDRIAKFDDSRANEVAKIDCGTCGLQVSGILALNLHYEEAHSMSIPSEVLKKFAERIQRSIDEHESTQHHNGNHSNSDDQNEEEDEEPYEKRAKIDGDKPAMMSSQLAMLSQMMGFPFGAMPPVSQSQQPNEMFGSLMNPANFAAAAAAAAAAANSNSNASSSSSPAKRARTRITDDQLKILRQYFNINNSPTEAQVKEMSEKSGLPEKVIKHWFRNTLFKERQRDKDSPYNFNIPPQLGIDLDTYEKTGEAKVVSLSSDAGIKTENNSARATPTTSTSSIDDGVKSRSEKPAAALNLQAMLSQMQQQQPSLPTQAASLAPFFDATQFMMSPAAAAAAAAAALASSTGMQHCANPIVASSSSSSSTPTNNVQSTSTSSSGRRANRTRFTDFQLRTLQQFFDKQAYPKDDDLEVLSKKLQLSPRVIVVWFQNARQKARKIYENQPNHENSDRFVRTPGSNFQCKRCNQVFQRYYELIQHQQKKCYKDDGAALASDNKSVEESLSEEEKRQLIAQQQAAQFANIQPADFLKLLGDPKSSNDVLLKMCETIGAAATAPTTSFNKQCPFCGVAFQEKTAMTEHLQSTHAQMMLLTPIDVDSLPDAAQTPEPREPGALDLSGAAASLTAAAAAAAAAVMNAERESLSTSPARSDDDVVTEALDDSQFATFGVPMPMLSSGNSECRSPASNKRYRTHLTPLQVQLMKHVFNEYKTPSMAECEQLGKEIGLHKRVVQVWFQNARAKERKSRAPGEDDSKSLQTTCDECDKTFATRLALQDHLFSGEHIGILRARLKSQGVSDVSTDGPPPEKKMSKSGASSATMDLTSFPFNLMNGMLSAGLPPFLDVNLLGTPINLLQIPEEVKAQITSDISNAKTSTVFSQDGQTVESLREALNEEESAHLDGVLKDVGWACTACTNVFQEEKKLKEHQKQMCNGCETMLTLTQIHYSCKLCSSMFCLQSDYTSHLTTFPHVQFKSGTPTSTASPSTNTATTIP